MEKVDLVDLYGIDLSVMNAFNFDTHHRMRCHNDLSSYTSLVRIRNVKSEVSALRPTV